MTQDTRSKYTVPVARPAFSLFKADTEQKGTPAMTATKKLTGAAAKSSRQAKLSVVRSEQPTTQQPQEQPTVNIQPTATDTDEMTMDELRALQAKYRADQHAVREQIKAKKDSQPAKETKQPKTLDTVVARQQESVGIGHVMYIASRALTRVKMGQDADTAVSEVAAREGEAAKGALDFYATGDYKSMREVLMAWCAVNAPLTVTKQHTQVSGGDDSDESSDEQ
jgi:hypothetical protein